MIVIIPIVLILAYVLISMLTFKIWVAKAHFRIIQEKPTMPSGLQKLLAEDRVSARIVSSSVLRWLLFPASWIVSSVVKGVRW